MGLTAKAKILARLASSPWPTPLHKLDIPGVSECSASARLREMAKEGLVRSVSVPGKRFTSWEIVPKDLVLPLQLKQD